MNEWKSMSSAPKDRMIIARENSSPFRVNRVSWKDPYEMNIGGKPITSQGGFYSRDGGILLPAHYDQWTEFDDVIELTPF